MYLVWNTKLIINLQLVNPPYVARMGNRQLNVTPTAHKKTTSGKSTAINKCLYSLGRYFAILVSPSLSNTFNAGQ